MSEQIDEPTETPTLEQIKANLLEVRDNVHFNIGSPQAIDHLLVSLVLVIDALQASPTQQDRREG